MADGRPDDEGERRLPLPEDIRKTPINPNPAPAQLPPDDRVDRIRRIQQNDLESLPYFLVAALIFVLTGPPLWLAQVLLYGFVATRLLHFAACVTAQTHDMRAMLWTPGSLILIFITCGRCLRRFSNGFAAPSSPSPRIA